MPWEGGREIPVLASGPRLSQVTVFLLLTGSCRGSTSDIQPLPVRTHPCLWDLTPFATWEVKFINSALITDRESPGAAVLGGLWHPTGPSSDTQ